MRRDPVRGTSWVRQGTLAATSAGFVIAAIGLVQSGCGEPAVTAPPVHACFEVADPYAVEGAWMRANFHMHTTHSDGAQTSGEAVALYGKMGYGVLALTDHHCYGDQDGGIVPALQNDSLLHDWNGDGILHPERRFGSGVEGYVRDWVRPPASWARDDYYSIRTTTEPIVLNGLEGAIEGFHIGCIGHPAGAIASPGSMALQRTRLAGGFNFLAHPGEWNSRPYDLSQALGLGAFQGLEIANGLRLTQAFPTPQPNAGKPGAEHATAADTDACAATLPWDATPLWDGLLARGYRLWGLANDDSHTWPGAETASPFSAYNWILVSDPTREGALEALHRGSFYGSTGLEFSTLTVRDGTIVVAASGAERVRFIGWNGRVLRDTEGDRDSYTVRGDEGYVRVEVTGAPTTTSWQPRAWSQPFYIQGVACGELPHRQPAGD